MLTKFTLEPLSTRQLLKLRSRICFGVKDGLSLETRMVLCGLSPKMWGQKRRTPMGRGQTTRAEIFQYLVPYEKLETRSVDKVALRVDVWQSLACASCLAAANSSEDLTQHGAGRQAQTLPAVCKWPICCLTGTFRLSEMESGAPWISMEGSVLLIDYPVQKGMSIKSQFWCQGCSS